MTPANSGYMTPAVAKQPMQTPAPIKPILNQSVQPQNIFSVGTMANGDTRMSDGSIRPAASPTTGVLGAGVDMFNPIYGSNATPSRSYSVPVTVGPTAQQIQMAKERQALIDQQTQQGLNLADQSYGDINADLNNQEGQIKSQYAGGQGYINQLKGSNVADISQQGDLSKRQARQSYQDSILQTRLRARAMGGAASSGFMDLTSRLDQALAGNLTNIDMTSMTALNKVKLTADKALTDLQDEMNKSINEIAKQKNTSIRERDKAKATIQMEAAEAALEIKSWLDGKTQTLTKTVRVGGTPNTIPSVANQAIQFKNDTLGKFSAELGNVKGANINANSPEFKNAMAKYGPALTSAGVNPNTISGYYPAPKEGYKPLTQQELDDIYLKSQYQYQGRYDAEYPEL